MDLVYDIYDTLQKRYGYTDEYIESKSISYILERRMHAVKRGIEEDTDLWRKYAIGAFYSGNHDAEKFSDFLDMCGFGYKDTVEELSAEEAVEQGLEVLEMYKAQGVVDNELI